MKHRILTIAENAKEASNTIRLLDSETKKEILNAVANSIDHHQHTILKANADDLKKGRAKGLAEPLLDRLSLTGRLDSIIEDVRKVAELLDPVGEIIEENILPNGLKLSKKRVPIGVLAVIYEARPNVTVDVAALALKTGNCAILRGGKETLATNKAIMAATHKGLKKWDISPYALQLIPIASRSALKYLLTLDHAIDLVIPRGGAGLHAFCRQNSTIPVITGGVGICHLFVDESANIQKAIPVIVNAKTQRPSVCNALDTLLVHEEIAHKLFPRLLEALIDKGVTFRLDKRAWKEIAPEDETTFLKAEEEDWQTEWMSLILGIKIVDSLEEAVHHIQRYSSSHSDGILTESSENAALFIQNIDSAAVYINASTRFTDGGQFGFGAEIAVSTQKLHARGPMGPKELTTYKWIVEGNYHTRA